MAAVSQHAMRRHPGSPLDSTPTPIQSPYYSGQQHQQALANADSKSGTCSPASGKKSWSQRLKISKNDKRAESPAAQSADMKYSEPRYHYGTVRNSLPPGFAAHAPAPAHFYAPMREMASAVLLCACSDYLHGTKKDTKKPTVCKKCRGTRLPLSQFGGTMRMHPTAPMIAQTMRGSVGTVRLATTVAAGSSTASFGPKSRPTILGSRLDSSDPYDMMRRSRLVSPELQPVNSVLKHHPSAGQTAAKGSRAKSTSPLRGRRSRSRSRRSPSPSLTLVPNVGQQRNVDGWVTEADMSEAVHPANGRRSILNCDFSAYELISKISHNNEFSPMADDDDDLYGMMPMLQPAASAVAAKAMPSPQLDMTALSGQRINFSKSGLSSAPQANDNCLYDRVDISPQVHRTAVKSPVRPPRGNHRAKADTATEESGAEPAPESSNEFALTASVLSHISNDIAPVCAPAVAQPNAIVIKSILKRPSSIGSDSQPSSLSTGGGGGGSCSSSHSDADYVRLSPAGGTEAASSIRFAKGKVCIALSKNTAHGTGSSPMPPMSPAAKEKRSSGSHFYLPMPQRKRVQFCVDTGPDSPANSAAHATEEAYFGQHDQRHLLATDDDGEDGFAVGCPAASDQPPLVSDKAVADLLLIDSTPAAEPAISLQRQPAASGNYAFAAAADYAPGAVTIVQAPQLATPAVAGHMNANMSGGHITESASALANAGPVMATSNGCSANAPSSAATAALIEIIPAAVTRIANNNRSSSNGDSVSLNGSTGSNLTAKSAATTTATDVAGNTGSATRSSAMTVVMVQAAAAPYDEDNNLPGTAQSTLLRRTHRDRRRLSDPAVQQQLAATSSNVSFHDTTALRLKANRHDTRTLFEAAGGGEGGAGGGGASPTLVVARPKDPPPPPPPARATDTKLTTPPIDYEETAPRWRSHEAAQGSRLFGDKRPAKVKLTAPLINRESPAVHRLQIRSKDPDAADPYECAAKKTSIMISGDDCYSTVNVSSDSQPMYHASVVVNGGDVSPAILKSNSNTVSISVTTPVGEAKDFAATVSSTPTKRSIIPIRDASTTYANQSRTLITVDYREPASKPAAAAAAAELVITPKKDNSIEIKDVISNDQELLKMLRNPAAIRANVDVPHVCGKHSPSGTLEPVPKKSPDTRKPTLYSSALAPLHPAILGAGDRDSFIGKLLEDPTLGHLAEGLDNDIVAKLIENSLLRLKETRNATDLSGTKDEQDMTKLIEVSLLRVKEERHKLARNDDLTAEVQSNRDSMSSANSFSSANYEAFDFDTNELSDCYQSCSSELTTADEDSHGAVTRSRFYQMLVDATLSEIEISTAHMEDGEEDERVGDDHHYESIRLNGDPIYEEINDMPPPLPLCPPPQNDCAEADKKLSKSMFEGASKYDILSYLVDAKERGLVAEDTYTYNFSNTSDTIIIEEEANQQGTINASGTASLKFTSAAEKNDKNRRIVSNEPGSRISHASSTDDARSLTIDDEIAALKLIAERKSSSDIERNDSGVGSETSKNSRSKYQSTAAAVIGGCSLLHKNSPIHLCEDCDGPVETQVTESGVMFAPLVCRKCGKKRAERKEIVTEIIETEEKYGRDLQIILEEFYQPMLVAGLLTQEQLSAIFLNAEELLENSQSLADKMRDAFDIALEQGDDDLLTVNIGRLLLEAAPMLHAFESYCVRQAAASLLLANMEKEKELLRIFLRVSQMENTVLRRMNLNSFLMVPVQRVTKYPLLLARLYKVTPGHLDGRDLLRQAQEKIELHLNHMNREAKDVPTKLWRRISSSSPNRRSTCEIDMINIKLRKMAIDLLEWHHDEVRFPVEGKLLFTQPTDNNWRKGRTIKLTPVNALLVTNGKPSASYKGDKTALAEPIGFPRHTGIREATLLLVREKSGRYTLLREPLFLDRCIVCTEADWEDYFELQEISSKETFIFKAEDGTRTKQWYTQLQHHSQGMGAWRKRRNALANIMINGMMMRS